MAGKSASLLTQTQRNRLRDNFDDLTDEKKRRDQHRIRNRVKSGILDFQLLAEYPDSQFVLAFDDVPDDELQAALADMYIVTERLRALREYNRVDLAEQARARTEEISDVTADTNTLEQIDLRPARKRRWTETEVKKRLGAGLLGTHARRLMALGVSTFILLVIVGISPG